MISTTERSVARNRDRWLLSYADFVTLLLALFILLYASSRLDSQQAIELVAGIQSAFPQVEESVLEGPPSEPDARPGIATEENPSLRQYLAAVIDVESERPGETMAGTRLREDERGIVIELAAAEFFPAGGVDLSSEKKQVLEDLAPILVSSGRSIHFEGHTDDQPIDSDVFPSNWELSAARAGVLARFFIEEQALDPSWVATTGYAQYRPLVPNLGEAARARNRRVEIVLLNPTGDATRAVKNPDADLESLGRMLDALPPVPDEADQRLRPTTPDTLPNELPLP